MFQLMIQVVRLVLLSGTVLFVSPVVVAQSTTEDESVQAAERTGVIDSVHGRLSTRLSDFIGQIDAFFGDEEESARVNESWARIRLDTHYIDYDDVEVKGNLKLKVVLPQAEKRLRLLVSTDDEDTGTSTQANESDSNDVSLALRFLRELRQNSSIKLDLGARVHKSKAQTFVRMGGYYRTDMGSDWTWTTTNNLTHFSRTGLENFLTFKFERYVDADREKLLLFSNQIGWEEHRKGVTLSQILGLYFPLDATASLAFEGMTALVSSPEPGFDSVQNVELRIRFRNSVWRKWFYFEVWPRVMWPEANDHETSWGLTLRAEAIVGPKP